MEPSILGFKFFLLMKKNKLSILLLAVLFTACMNNSSKPKSDDENPSVCVYYESMKSSTKTIGEVMDSIEIAASRPIYNQLLAELDSTDIYDDSILHGYWFKPHEACAVNIFFHKNGRFEFKYYIVENDTTIIDVVKKGTFEIGEADINKSRVVTMFADDGWDGNVFNGKIHYRCNRTHYFLEDKKSGLYLVKGSD